MYVADFDVVKMVDEIQKENGMISEVYFVACGGSLMDSKQRVCINSAKASR